jgi:polysaccharide biosynthesis/export protein
MNVRTGSCYNSYKKIMKRNLLFALLVILFTTSCSKRNLVYFSDLPESEEYKITVKNEVETKIQVDDLLGITVNSLNPESDVLFNSGVLPTVGANGGGAGSSKTIEGYLIDKNGMINFPVIGKIKLVGLSKAEAVEKMTAELKLHVKNPIVNIRFLNFKITVVGEVNHPASFVIPTEKINIIEALGLAGDMTVFGKRENVLIIREKEGVRTTTRINLNNKALLASQYFYLQQNDIVYVEPVKSKANQASLAPYRVSLVLSVVSILSIFIVRFLD